jgi:2-iminobutanoate/2-iminopropanoate deaminase
MPWDKLSCAKALLTSLKNSCEAFLFPAVDGGNVSIMQRQRVTTTGAPAAIGPYSQAIVSDGLVFVSGQVPLAPETGQMVAGDVQVQTRRALHNLAAVLEAAGTSLAQVVKTTVFLTTMENFTPMNEVYAEFFPGDPPARSTVAVVELPKGALVEIEAIAVRMGGN